MNIPELLHEYETRLLKDRLLVFPGKIKHQKAEVRKYREDLKAINQKKEMFEANLMAAIAAEKDPNTGKAAFSNVEARQAELSRRKMNVARYCELVEEAKNAEFLASEAQEELEFLMDLYRSNRIAAQIVTAELNVLALQEENGEEEAPRYAAAGAEARQPY